LGLKHGLCKNGKATLEYELWNRAKTRSKRKGLEFSIKVSDIVVPKKCPLLGVEMIRSNGKLSRNSPSLDRIDPHKGYTPDNIWVISQRANSAKQDLSVEELKILVDKLEQKIVEQKIHNSRKSK
jgi:hypothetical protein